MSDLKNINPNKTNRFGAFLLIGILIVGSILRFYHFFLLPFMFDELSTAGRHYKSLSELIQVGIKENDVHPIFVYVFIYGWEKLFGNAEWVVKLPFILMGIASIYLTYRLAKEWFNESCGLFAALFIATLQYTVSYSTIARPYSSGLFFSLLMVICWSNYLFKAKKNNINYLIGFIFTASVCMYNHYFSFLFAIIVSFTGLFFLKKENWKYYIGAGVLIILLFLPHLPITLYQLGKGGLGGADGWLPKPENDFFLKYIGYIFHYSFISGGITFCIVLFYLIKYFKTPDTKNKRRIICLVWFLVPFLIGFFYSRMVNPILQFSALLFSFPFFIILICSFIQEQRKLVITTLLVLIATANIYSLIYQRRHYEIMLHQPSSEYAKYIIQLQKENPKKKVYAILSTTEIPFMEYYKEQLKTNFNYRVFNPKTDKPFALFNDIKKQNADLLVTGFISDEFTGLLREEFPKHIYHTEGFTYDINCFSKDTSAKEVNENILFDELNTFDKKPLNKAWAFDLKSIQYDSSTKNNFLPIDSSMEWGPSFKIPLNEVIKNRNSEIVASMKVKPSDASKNAVLVLQLNKGDSMIRWQGSDLKNFTVAGNEWQSIYTSLRMIDVLKPGQDPSQYTLNIYYWNKDKQKVYLDDMHIQVKAGNPLIYGLYENIIENE